MNRAAACTALLVVALAACGRKAPIRPPEDVVAQTISDLAASDSAAGVELAWSRPRRAVDGSELRDLGGFVIERASGDLDAPYQRVATVDVTDRDRFRQVGRFRYLDRATTVGTEYRYRVVSFSLDRYFSAPSNVATVDRTQTDENTHAPLPGTKR